jgi:hypothetical protein
MPARGVVKERFPHADAPQVAQQSAEQQGADMAQSFLAQQLPQFPFNLMAATPELAANLAQAVNSGQMPSDAAQAAQHVLNSIAQARARSPIFVRLKPDQISSIGKMLLLADGWEMV